MARQNPESDSDFLRMQQEAILRVREMQSRARATLENAGMHIENNDAPDFTSAQANIGRSQTSAASQDFSVDGNSGTTHTENTRFANAHSNAPHSENTRSTTSHPDNARDNEPHSGAQRQPDMRSSAPRQNQRPEDIHAPFGKETDFLHMSGLNLALDSDQLLLLATLYLLIKDGSDKWLILSLAYVMLT